MALTTIGMNYDPSYLALAADIVDDTISGISFIGRKVYITDVGKTYIILPDLTLVEYKQPAVYTAV